MAKSTCATCGEVFNSVRVFDAHRVGDYEETIYQYSANGKKTGKAIGVKPATRRCLSVEEMQARGMLRNARGWWIESAYDPRAHQKIQETEAEEIEQDQAS